MTLETRLAQVKDMSRVFNDPTQLVDAVVDKMSDTEVEQCTNEMGYSVVSEYAKKEIHNIDTHRPHTETLRLVLRSYFMDQTKKAHIPEMELVPAATGTYG